MSVAVWTSFQQISDASGNAYVGAKVNVYAAGTTTPLTVYSDTGLSIVAANPIVCDASGQHAMRYIATASYKTTVTTSADAPLSSWSKDNIDPGVAVGSGALPILNGGTGSSTAGGARANLGVPSQTEVDDIASDVSTLQAAINAISGAPPGRLTPSSGIPVISSDVSAAANIYYTPYIGAQCPIWNGSAFVLTTFAELNLPLVANHLASTIYDCFVISDSGTTRLVTGPAWNTSTAGSGARGAGAGTTELTRQSGILVNANSMTARYGATTLTVAAKQGTYVGSIFIDGSAGQVTCHTSYGQSRKFGVWNAYNRRRIILKAGDGTASWTYATASYRNSNNAAANKLTTFVGLDEEELDISFTQHFNQANAAGSTTRIGIGVNAAGSPSGTIAQIGVSTPNGGWTLSARYRIFGSIGVNDFNSLEFGNGNTPTFRGTETDMLLTSDWWG